MKFFWTIALLAISVVNCGAVLPGDDFNADTATAVSVLQQWYNASGLWDTTGWWNAANCVDAVESQIVIQNGGSYLGVLTNTYNLNSSGDFLNYYYDDEGWWTEAWIKAYDLTGNIQFLNMAKTIFGDMTGGWDASCGGGLWWSKARTYKNAIPNELFLLDAIRLHQRTPGDGGPGSYFYWATNEWNWFSNSGLINSQHLINDGLTNCVNNGETVWTYNQGVVLGGLVDLYKSTGNAGYLTEAETLAGAAMAKLSSTAGVLQESCNCGGDDVPQFKGIFIRHLAELYDVDHKPAYLNYFYTNAHSVWANDRNSSNQLGYKWAGPFDTNDAARHSCALNAICTLAEPSTALLPFARGAGDWSFAHNVGQASGTLGWTCSPAIASTAGFMIYGPYLASLNTGVHTAHFRMSASATNNSTAMLVQLIIIDNGLALAASNVAWNSFSQANQSQDFALAFTNSNPGSMLQFEVYWSQAAGAPAVTVSDITVDGAHNWTAASLSHSIGRLDGLNAWEADPVRDTSSGYLSQGPSTGELTPGPYTANFELKVDNFNWDNAAVATLSVVNTDTGATLASQSIIRTEFPDTLYHSFAVSFQAVAGGHYDFRTYWIYATNAPRLTERSVVVSPSGSPGFAPMALAPGSYNQDIVIEYAAPVLPNGACTTASMDAGTGNTGNSWYEQGYDASAPLTGLPPAGSTITNSSASDHTYTFAPSYAAANVVFIDSSHAAAVIPTVQGLFSGVSFLAAAGHGPVVVDYNIHHGDGTFETGAMTIPDWFNNAPVAYDAHGRVNVVTGSFNSVNNNNPNLYAGDAWLTNRQSPVTAINLNWDSANTGSGVAAIFAVSGLASPQAPVNVQISPLSQSEYVGTQASFSVTVSGTPPFSYQWKSNSALISGATASTLTLANLSAGSAGSYSCVVKNNSGLVASAAALLMVVPLPVLQASWSNNTLTLSWAGNGLLLQATNITGPWQTNSVSSPYQTNPAAPSLFYRLQAQ